MTNANIRRSLTTWLLVGTIASILAGCSPEINRRGYLAKPGAFGQINEGMPKSEVEGILGSPSTTASVNFEGDSYYYVTSTTESRSFLKPVETSREVIAIRFNRNDAVASFAQYALEDGRVINVNSRKTPVVGRELSLIQDFFAGVFRSKPGVGVGG